VKKTQPTKAQPAKNQLSKSKPTKTQSMTAHALLAKPSNARSVKSGQKHEGLNPKAAGKARKPGDCRAKKVSSSKLANKTKKSTKKAKVTAFDVFGDDGADFSFG
jgi:hypothetical protein